MSDIKLFRISDKVKELPGKAVMLEKSLQTLIENKMEMFFGVRFLCSEYSTTHGGRIDSLGLDENYCPVIFEYKRSTQENVINQGLFYLDWLLDHKADFELLVMKQLGKNFSEKLEWGLPRLICVASGFTKYDEHAVKQINRNIDLVRYKKFGEELILFELIHSKTVPITKEAPASKVTKDKTFEDQLNSAGSKLKGIYSSIRDYILSLGDDITENQLKLYVAFKKIRNIVCVEINPQRILLYLRLNPEEVVLEKGFTRDVRNIGHWGTGDLEVTIRTMEDFEKAKPLIDRSYQEN